MSGFELVKYYISHIWYFKIPHSTFHVLYFLFHIPHSTFTRSVISHFISRVSYISIFYISILGILYFRSNISRLIFHILHSPCPIILTQYVTSHALHFISRPVFHILRIAELDPTLHILYSTRYISHFLSYIPIRYISCSIFQILYIISHIPRAYPIAHNSVFYDAYFPYLTFLHTTLKNDHEGSIFLITVMNKPKFLSVDYGSSNSYRSLESLFFQLHFNLFNLKYV